MWGKIILGYTYESIDSIPLMIVINWGYILIKYTVIYGKKLWVEMGVGDIYVSFKIYYFNVVDEQNINYEEKNLTDYDKSACFGNFF